MKLAPIHFQWPNHEGAASFSYMSARIWSASGDPYWPRPVSAFVDTLAWRLVTRRGLERRT